MEYWVSKVDGGLIL